MEKISTTEAVKTISEWGVDCDNFVAHNYRQMMVGGEPTDNSIDLGFYFMECLKIVCDIGIESHNQPVQATEKDRA